MKTIAPNEKLLQRIEWVNGILLAVLVLGAWILASAKAAFGVFLGGGIATLSFQIMKWQMKKALLTPGRTPQKGGLFATYYLRFLGVLFVVFVVMYYRWADPIAFLVGLSVVVLSIVVVGGFAFLSMHMTKGDS